MRFWGTLVITAIATLLMGSINIRDEGVKLNPPQVQVDTINCSGAGVTCTYSMGTATISVSGAGGAGGSGAPIDATYITQTSNATLTNEQALASLSTGLMSNTTGTGVVSIYAGSSCSAGQYAKSTNASGALTCGQVNYSELTGTCSYATPAAAGCVSTTSQSFGGNKSFPDGVATPHIDGGALLSVAATSMRFYGSDALWNQSVSFANNAVYFSGGTASADFYNGLATGGPIIPNTNGNGLTLWHRRLDGVQGVATQGQHWFDGGLQFSVYLPVCGASNPAQLGVTTDHVYYGSAAKADCTGSTDLELGALVDSNTIAGHTSLMTGAKLELILRGHLSGNHTAWETGAPPTAPNPANYPAGVVCTETDGGTYFCYAGRHGHVVAGSREESKQGWLFEVQNPNRSPGAHVFYVTYWGSFGQEDQIEFSKFPDAGMPGIVTTEGQYAYAFSGELAHDKVVLGDYTTGRWRSRETNPDGGPEWVALIDTNDPIPTTQLSGVLDVPRGGTGSAPGAGDQLLVSDSTSAATWRSVPDCTDTGGNHLNYTAASNTFSCGTSGGGGAPTNASYVTSTAEASLSNEQNIGALTTGLMLNTVSAGTGTISAYTGTSCTNQFPRSLNASGAATCASVADTDLTSNYSGVGSCTNQFVRAVNDNAAPTCATVTSSDVSLTTTSCTNQFITAISSGGVGTCTTDTLASAQHANQGTTTTLLHGNAAGNPSWSSVVSADMNITTTSCTNQFVTAISSGGVGTCTTGTLASAQYANQGTTTQVLHGNAAGNPSWSAVSLPNDTTGTLGVGKGGTGQTTITTNQIYVGTALDTLTAKTLPSCSNGTTSKLLFNNSTQEFTCGTDQTGGGGGNWGNFTVSFGTGAISRYESDQAVVSAGWVTGTSEIIVRPKCYVPVGSNTVENCLVLQIECQVIAVSAGVSFTVQCMTPYTASGSYTISYTGA